MFLAQRYVPLSFSGGYGTHGGGRLTVTAPANT